ncbi:hypothetical protein TNCV_1430791 [Trichonephila clavipes]|nr:hypothetical protein TNCV_1430791 [Trichonephila clavipes]
MYANLQSPKTPKSIRGKVRYRFVTLCSNNLCKGFRERQQTISDLHDNDGPKRLLRNSEIVNSVKKCWNTHRSVWICLPEAFHTLHLLIEHCVSNQTMR